MTPDLIAELQHRIHEQERKIQVARPSEPEFGLILENQAVILRVLRELIEDR